MKIRYYMGFLGFLFLFLFVVYFASNSVSAEPNAQFPTISVPTVTGTASGPLITVRPGQNEPSVNVRSGPNVLYSKIGVLLVGQTVEAVGISPGGEWIQIIYPGVQGGKGWVFAIYVTDPGPLPVLEPPPSPTPQYTATIDPTLAAQFVITTQPTRLPTYTSAAPIVIPTFEPYNQNQLPGGIPVGLIIVVLGVVGILLSLFSFFSTR
ncbi:MAG: hypothetical protein CVU46_17290 [Chloroflexi bacterium HGW-Chloroflexi-8]|nr:MAG: hypothetical protein CVU46_17290 [Chloroflexi bacterium HGW-Chloroflexi-8]